jgi:DeoR/GlpR family transcriptional regulator of sugar metabolism
MPQVPLDGGRDLLAAERRDLIVRLLRERGRLVAAELATELRCSPDTVRRDLDALAARGLAQRVHGGALPPSPVVGAFAARAHERTDAKAAIARVAAELVVDGSVVILGGGTTCMHVARGLPPDLRATIFTSSPPAVEILARHPGIRVELIGGTLLPETMTTAGPAAIAALRGLRADRCLLGPCALHPALGISVTDAEERHVTAASIAAASEVVALATHDKLDTALPFIVAPANALGTLVVDQAATPAQLAPYEQLGVVVLRADGPA